MTAEPAAQTGPAAPRAMPDAEELEAYLRGRAAPVSRLDGLDGYLTAVLIGAPWVLMTPLSDKLIAFFDRYLPSRISAK